VSVLLDTHALLWWRIRSRHLSVPAANAIDRAQWLGIPDIVLWEFCQLVTDGRVHVPETPGAWLRLALLEPRLEVVPIGVEIAVAASSLKASFRLDPVDSLVAASGIRLGIPVVTRDTRMREIPGLETIW
jgi:PIN domain nuclease of toxin-antitoxin system